MKKYGYRNIWYDARGKNMHIWGWNKDKKRTYNVEPFNPYLYVETTGKPDAISIYNTNLKKLIFPSQFERRRYAKECGIKRIFYNIRAEQQYALDCYKGLNDAPEFIENPLKIFIIDIEIYSTGEFPTPEEAKYPINLITIYDSIEKRFNTFGTGEYDNKEEGVSYYRCRDEFDLIKKFLKFWTNDYPDCVVGWNSDGFDIPYIINRIKNIFDIDTARTLSPVKNLYYKESIMQKFGRDIGRWEIHGISVLDYMEIYQTFSMDKRESYSLNYIAEAEGVGSKVKYNTTSLSKLADTNWDEFVKYNIQDVNLIVKLEEKLKFIQVMRMISHKGYCNMEATLGKVAVVTGAIAGQALSKGKILCTFEKDNMGGYTGGYVKEVEPGLKDSIITFDADSLYPNCIITLNISPEKKIGKIINANKKLDEIRIKLVNNKEHTLTYKNFSKFIEKEKIAISRSKVLFSQKEVGIVPEYVDGLYSERVSIRKEFSEKSKIEGFPRLELERLDNLQYTIKILLNSIYGVFANQYGPLYDIDCASSITNTGQDVIKEAANILNGYMLEKYGIDEDVVIYGDTDSTHFTIQPILDKLDEKFFDDNNNITERVYEIAKDFNDILNKRINEWSRDRLNSIDSRFHFKREAICSVCLYEAKKHYILYVRDKGNKDPIPCNYIKPVGVELVKTTLSDEIKEAIREIVMSILTSKSWEKTIDIYRKKYEEFKKMAPEDVAFRSAIKTYDKYASMSKGFDIAKRTPAAVSASIFYNELLKEFNIDSIYENLVSGDRVKWVYLNPSNIFNIDKLAFNEKIPTEFKDLEVDYNKMFKKILEPPVKRLFTCAGWRMVDMRAEYTVDLLDLFK